MTLQWIPLEALEPHPENSNRMPARLMEKLKGHIQRTGLYEPLVVRRLRIVDCGLRIEQPQQQPKQSATPRIAPAGSKEIEGAKRLPQANPQSEIRNPQCRYQILNGHHRAEVLRQLGHSHARCDVWEVDDAEARVLLATLNRLEGRDDPAARARLVARLAESRPPADLAKLLPEPADAVERLLALARPPAAAIATDDVEPIPQSMTFFLTEEQHALVTEALGEIVKSAAASARGRVSRPACGARLSRSETLERLALWYLESRHLR
jgi:ParB-like chromosome segregation protein Spo0J